jgi:hypothetical protein
VTLPPDTEKALWMTEHIQRDCGLRSFTYVVMPNDHTVGLDPGARTPEDMIADNDQAIGIVADAVSHSTYWPSTVIFVIEDDPQDGGDHVDNHRSPLIVISPWARRGVSSVHYSEASIWRRSASMSARVAWPYTSGSRVPSRLRLGPCRTNNFAMADPQCSLRTASKAGSVRDAGRGVQTFATVSKKLPGFKQLFEWSL